MIRKFTIFFFLPHDETDQEEQVTRTFCNHLGGSAVSHQEKHSNNYFLDANSNALNTSEKTQVHTALWRHQWVWVFWSKYVQRANIVGGWNPFVVLSYFFLISWECTGCITCLVMSIEKCIMHTLLTFHFCSIFTGTHVSLLL